MGRKGKSKAKKLKKVKNAMKKKNKKAKLQDINSAVNRAEKTGIDVGSLAESALSGIPFVGPLLGDVVGQAVSGAGAGGISGRGGVRGVQLVDSRLGNLGTISRKKALSVLMNRGKKAPRRAKPTFISVPTGQSVVRV